jgi:nitrate reductase gamma subunit
MEVWWICWVELGGSKRLCNILFLFGCGIYITFMVFTMFIIFSINIYGIMDISINLDYRKYGIGIMVISINLDYRKYGIG